MALELTPSLVRLGDIGGVIMPSCLSTASAAGDNGDEMLGEGVLGMTTAGTSFMFREWAFDDTLAMDEVLKLRIRPRIDEDD